MSRLADFRCAVITGGGGGIGKAIAQYFISKGKTVLLAGRTEANLQSAAKEIGAAGYYLVDVGNTADMAPLASRITREHPELDCLVNNAGVPATPRHCPGRRGFRGQGRRGNRHQHPRPHASDAGAAAASANPARGGALIINVSSILGFVPFSIVNPVYNGTKAWLHFWTMNLRSQLQRAGSRVGVVEIAPPTVATDLHRERDDPDDNKKAKNAQSLDVAEFTGEVARKLEHGLDMVSLPGLGMTLSTSGTLHTVRSTTGRPARNSRCLV